MSANGEAPFFNAPELTQRDGTLSGAPSETFADPASGPVAVDSEGRPVGGGQEHARVPVAGPVQHDEEAVRRMVEETLRDDGPKPQEHVPPAGTTVPPAGTTSGDAGEPPLGLLPRQRNRQRTWPSRPAQLMRPNRQQSAPAAAGVAEDDFDDDLDVVPAKRRKLPKLPSMSMPALNKPSSNTAGIMLAVALLIVFGIVAIEMVSSLVSSVTGLFN